MVASIYIMRPPVQYYAVDMLFSSYYVSPLSYRVKIWCPELYYLVLLPCVVMIWCPGVYYARRPSLWCDDMVSSIHYVGDVNGVQKIYI